MLQEIDLKDGKEYIIDNEFNNGGKVTLVRKGRYFCTVRDEETGGEWETMCNRLTEIENNNP
jgi:hypothetical protein